MMKTVVPIILFVAVAGFHNVVSLCLESAESNESSEEMVVEERTTPEKHDVEKGALTGTTGNQEENTSSQTAETTNTEGYKHSEEEVGENVESRRTSSYSDEEMEYYES